MLFIQDSRPFGFLDEAALYRNEPFLGDRTNICTDSYINPPFVTFLSRNELSLGFNLGMAT
jgi:hypothetical protein